MYRLERSQDGKEPLMPRCHECLEGAFFPLPKSKCSTLELFRSWIIKRERNNPSDIRCSCHLSVRYAGLATVPPPRGRHSHRCCAPFSSAIRLIIMSSLALRGPLRLCCEFESRCCFFSQRSFLTRCCLLSKRSQLKATTDAIPKHSYQPTSPIIYKLEFNNAKTLDTDCVALG